LKSYCKGLLIDRNIVSDAYKLWRENESGKKNSWRVYKEYGSEYALIDEIYNEIRDRELRFRPLKIDIGGWRAFDGHVTIRRNLFLRAMRAFRRFNRHPSVKRAHRVISYWGWLKHGDCYEVIENMHMEDTFNNARNMVSAHQRMMNKKKAAANDKNAVSNAA
jgi:hypothetical protein